MSNLKTEYSEAEATEIHYALQDYIRHLHWASSGQLPDAFPVAPETWHVFQSERHLLTDSEHETLVFLAFVLMSFTCSRKRDREQWARKAQKRRTPEIDALLEQGEQKFLATTCARILHEHGLSILNLCPQCGALARTPTARQCPKCFFNWRK